MRNRHIFECKQDNWDEKLKTIKHCVAFSCVLSKKFSNYSSNINFFL